ncbi:MAG: lysine--tRNA ligase, partial [Solobacterium sp.]|nr:lysine--tRNA ligase [Solobacterium sp.]
MAEEMTKEEKQRIKEERRRAFLEAHPELAAKQQEASEKKKVQKQKKDEAVSTEEQLNDQQTVRREKMNDLRAKGIDPFGQAYHRTHRSGEIRALFGGRTLEELEAEDNRVSIAGRIMTKRRLGKLGFIHIQDIDGQIQAVVTRQIVGDEIYELFKASDLGDIVGIEGTVIKTQAGELSVLASSYTHLSKALRPLPEKFHGLQDKEERFRRR